MSDPGLWLVRLGCRGEGGGILITDCLLAFLGVLPWIVHSDPSAYVLKETPMRTWRLVCNRGLMVPGADIHPQCVLARVGPAPLTHPKSRR